MPSITSQFSWVLSSSSSVLVTNDKSNNVRHANFSQIPSWFSLKSSPPSLRTNPNKQGEVENLHLISLTKQGKLREVHEFIERMDKEGISINPQSYEYLFKMCGTLRTLSDGRLFHNRLQGSSNSNKHLFSIKEVGIYPNHNGKLYPLILKQFVDSFHLLKLYHRNSRLHHPITQPQSPAAPQHFPQSLKLTIRNQGSPSHPPPPTTEDEDGAHRGSVLPHPAPATTGDEDADEGASERRPATFQRSR